MRRYFEQEMRYLQEAGKAFAQSHPEQGRLLNTDSLTDRDPYVERLFEGFALLAGRVHERLDDELPEYTEGLFSLLYPQFLRPIPSLSIAQFTPRAGQVSEPFLLPAGTRVKSDPVGPLKTVCRFATTEAVPVRPLHLDEAKLELEHDNTHSLRITLRVLEGSSIPASSMRRVRLYFHADAGVASFMHMFLTRHVEELTVRLLSNQGTVRGSSILGSEAVSPIGLADDEGLLPRSEYTFPGIGLLHEYLNFRRRFWGVDLNGLDALGSLESDQRIQVSLKFDREYPEEKSFSEDNVRLHCCPIVNLFELDAEPISASGFEAEYRVVEENAGAEVFDIRRVVGTDQRRGTSREYRPYHQFDSSGSAGGCSFVQTFRVGPNDRRTAYLTLVNEHPEEVFEPEVLSVDLRCTNGTIPRERLQERTLVQLETGSSAVDTANLTQPSLILYPPAGRQRDFFWHLLSHMALNYVSVATPEGLKEVLRLYDWSGSDANRRRINGIRDVTWKPKAIVYRGSILRGGEVTIEVQQDHFADDGDLCLFGLVMSEFMSMHSSINSFAHVTIVEMPSERRFEWEPLRGKKRTL